MSTIYPEFSEKLKLIKEYYTRYSFIRKFNLLIGLVTEIKNHDLVQSVINPLYDKIVFYSLSM